MGGRKRGGCFFNWIRSELPDTQEPKDSVVLLAVKKSSSPIPVTQESEPEEGESHESHTHVLAQLNDRLRKTLSLDNRRINGVHQQTDRPKSMVHSSCCTSPSVARNKNVKTEQDQQSKNKSNKKKKFRPKSFFSLETFLDSRRSDSLSRNDHSSSKYCKFYLDTPESSPLFHGRNTPDLLDTPGISTGESTCKKRLDKLENHYNKIQKLKGAQVHNNERNDTFLSEEEDLGAVYSEPLYSSQSTLVVSAKNNVEICCDKREASFNCLDYCGIGFRDHLEELKCSEPREVVNDSNGSNGVSESNSFEIVIKRDDVLINDRTKDLVVKTMDKSMDSIGSCSLDVDADNTDFSDTTSGSLNILTPSSTTSHFREFTSRLQERAGLGYQRQDLKTLNEETQDHFLLVPSPPRKKPSYLHLACSVNGYSNITTYDSKLRQKLSRSREASPGRFGDTLDMLRECTDDAMATRLNATNTNNYFKTSFSETSITSNKMTYSKSNGVNNNKVETHASKSYSVITNGTNNESNPSKSFIQQRVERLYGPAALAQGFFNQRRQKTKSQCDEDKINGENFVIKSPDGLHQVSRLQSLKRTPNGTVTEHIVTESYSNGKDTEPPLPVLRHLTPEFRAQLPILSPKRSVLKDFLNTSDSDSSLLNSSFTRLTGEDVIDRGTTFVRHSTLVTSPLARETTLKSPQVTIVPIEREVDLEIKRQNGHPVNLNEEFEKMDITVTTLQNNVSSDNKQVNGVSESKIVAVKQTLDDNSNPVLSDVNIPNDSVKEVIVDLAKSDCESVNKTVIGDESAIQPKCSGDTNVIHDAHYFLELKRKETERLIALAETAERDLEELQTRGDASEEVLGFLRAAAGKARLLATQKMQQFEGLCYNNLNCGENEPFPTTCDDLRGFWDMVSLQLSHVSLLFEQLHTMRQNGWKEIPVSVKMTEQVPTRLPVKTSQKSTTKKSQAANSADTARAAAAAKRREEQRKALMLARRNKMNSMKTDEKNTSVEIFVPQSKSEDGQTSSMGS